MGIAKKVAQNTVVQVVGRVLSTIISLTTVGLLNSGLKAEGWGHYVVITTFVGFFAVIADLGLNTYYLREISRYPEKIEDLTARFLGFRIASGLIVLGLVPVIAYIIPSYRPNLLGFALISLAQLFLVLNQILVSIFQSRLKMLWPTVTDIIGRAAILFGVFYIYRFVPQDSRLIYVCMVMIIGNLLNLISSYIVVSFYQKIRVRFVVSEWLSILLKILPMGSLAVIGLIHFKVDSVILSLYKPAKVVGVYGNAYKIMETLLTLPGMFMGTMFPILSKMVVDKDPKLKAFFQKAFDLMLYGLVTVMIFVWFLAPLVIGLLTRDHVSDAYTCLRILNLAILPWFLGSISGNMLLAMDKQRQLTYIQLFALVVNIILNVTLIPIYSYYGAAVTTIISELIVMFCSYNVLFKAMNYRLDYNYLKKFSIPALIVVAVLVIVNNLKLENFFAQYELLNRGSQLGYLILIGGLSFGFYLATSLLFKVFPPAIQEKIRNGKD